MLLTTAVLLAPTGLLAFLDLLLDWGQRLVGGPSHRARVVKEITAGVLI